MNTMQGLSALFFDFDGVIMDSMPLKLQSYRYAFAPWKLDGARLPQLQMKYAGLSRQKSLGLMYQDLTGNPINNEQFDLALERYTDHDDRSRRKMRAVPGTMEFLQSLPGSTFTAIVTGTPQAVIDKTISVHRLTPYFDRVCGTPPEKKISLQHLLTEYAIESENSVMIGDAITDQLAAQYCNMRFVGICTGDYSFDKEQCWRTVDSLLELAPYVRQS